MIHPRPANLFSLCVLMIATGGCLTRVTLPQAPPRTAPIAERARFYQSYRPSSVWGTTTYSNGFGGPVPVATRWDALVLSNGAVVEDPRDLVRVVGEDSPTAAAAAESARNTRISEALVWGGVGASVVGAVLALVSLTSRDASVDGPGVPTLFWVGAGISIGGSLAISTGRWAFGSSASSTRAAAFGGYDGALRARLDLCGSADEVRDCATSAAPSTQAPTTLTPLANTPASAWGPPPPPAPASTP
ncbi:MAG: hypothetical protein U0326_35500 [Polyangiales bacterium]